MAAAKEGSIYIRLDDTYPLSHVLVYGADTSLAGLEVKQGPQLSYEVMEWVLPSFYIIVL